MNTTTQTSHPIPADLLARWRQVPVPIAVDLMPEQQIDPAIRPLRAAGRQPRLCALAVTARCEAPDFGAVLRALECVGAGDVLVIAAGANETNAMIGEILGGYLHSRDVAGVVCDGAIRDTGALAGLENFAVFTRHITPRGPTGAAAGEVNVPVTLGGCRVEPGDLILGDDDGLISFPAQKLATMIDAAEEKLQQEEVWIRRLFAGDPVSKVFGLD